MGNILTKVVLTAKEELDKAINKLSSIADDNKKLIEENKVAKQVDLNKLSSQMDNKANLNQVKEEISKAQLEGAGVDTTNFAMRSDYEFVQDEVFNINVNEITTGLNEDKYANINNGIVELVSSTYYNVRIVDVNYNETYLITSRLTNNCRYVVLYADDSDNLIKSELQGTNTDKQYIDYLTTVPLGATKLYVTIQEENVNPTVKKKIFNTRIKPIEDTVLNIDNSLYKSKTTTIDSGVVLDSYANLNNNIIEILSSQYYNLKVVDVIENDEFIISARMTHNYRYIIIYTDNDNNLIKSELKGTGVDVVYNNYKTTVPMGATKLYVTTQEEDNNILPIVKKVKKVNRIDELEIQNEQNFDYLNLLKIKDNFRYLVPTFTTANNTGDGLILLGTNNLTMFDLVEKKGLYNATKSRYFRDPAIIKINEYYYLLHTEVGFESGDKVGMCKTKDFVNFEELDLLTLPSDSNEYYQIWAPCWFRENEDIYITSTCRFTANESFHTAIHKYDPVTHEATFINVISETGSSIDGHIYKENDKYYMAIGGGNMYVSDNLLSGYTKINNNNLNYNGYEANYCVRMDNGKWIMYMQELTQTFGTSHMVYVTADSLGGIWSDPKPVTYTEKALDYIRSLDTNTTREYFHWTVFDFNNTLGNNNNN